MTETIEARKDGAAEAGERFSREAANHKMTVLHDDGLYRHLRFRDPKNSCYWFELITVPHALIFRGDGETFAFSRIEDMFEFFRGPVGSINPVYWAEKLTSDRDSVMRYDERLFEQQVAEYFEETEAEKEYPGVTAAWNERVSGVLPEYYTSTEYEARAALDDFEYLPEGASGEPFSFYDTWEWQLRDYHWWFLWALHGIVWGIAQYDAARRGGEG